MVLVPVHVVDLEGVPALGHQLGACLAFGTLVDGALLSPDQELTVTLLGTLVEAGGRGQTRDGGLLGLGALVACVLVVELEHVDDHLLVLRVLFLEFELHDDFAFELALDQTPGAELAIAGNRLETLGEFVGVPPDLPDGVVVLATLHGAALLRLGELVADVLDQHGAVVAADAQQLGLVLVEVKAHDSGVRGDFLLGLLVVLE